MFSLGATLLFAATGHAPYQGETVMDILVRLATEPPDLAGLPAELAGIVTACLERSPRDRPTSAAVLAHLAPYVESASGPGPAPPPLPGPAIALIAEYQRHPQPPAAAQADEISDDATFGSHAALAPPRRPSPRAGPRTGPGGAGPAGAPGAVAAPSGHRRAGRAGAGRRSPSPGWPAGRPSWWPARAGLGAALSGPGQPSSAGTPRGLLPGPQEDRHPPCPPS